MQLKDQARVIRQQNRAESEALRAASQARLSLSRLEAEETLCDRRLLREFGEWLCVPHTCPALFLHRTASEACRTVVADGISSGRGALKRLSEGWRQRHLGIREPGRRPNIKAVKQSECSQQGCCVCRTPVRQLWVQIASTLRRRCQHPPLSETLVQSKMFLLWVGSSSKISEPPRVADPSLVYRLTYIALQYLKPWRPTFVEATLQSSLAEFLSALPQDGPLDSSNAWHVVSLRMPTDALPIYTPFAFAQTLDLSLHWSVLLLELSGRSTPFIQSAGQVKARVCCETFLEAWSPEGPLDAALDVDALGLEEEVGPPNNEFAEEELLLQPVEACEAEAGDDEVAPPDCDEDLGSVGSGSRGRNSSRNSSRSGSRSSSTSSSCSRNSGSSRSSKNSERNPPPVPAGRPAHDHEVQNDDAAANEGAGGSRQRRPDTFTWGHFVFTRRVAPPGWQVLCKYHKEASAACTKTASCSDVEAVAVIRRLKSWALTACAQTSDPEVFLLKLLSTEH